MFGSKDNFLGLGVLVDTCPKEEKQQEVRHTGWVTLMSHTALHPQGSFLLLPLFPFLFHRFFVRESRRSWG